MAHIIPAGYIVEYYTFTDGWRQCRSGYLWKTERAAEAYRAKWASDQKRDSAWEPETRVDMLVRSGPALVSASSAR